ncbi:MAG: plasmid stabilization protein [Verrucomicrobiota bacterium]|jgi:mRNA-degrading endonuclease YafQ of YafQ-DinJ toxin-antitoxin module|nr:plasmid stabilization protein [Verrucomicrobiota bacterium]
MPYPLIFTEGYSRRAERFLKKHPDLLGVYEKTLRLLELEPRHPALRLHKLQGRLKQLYAVSVTRAYRITLSFAIMRGSIVLIDIGTHDDVYE